MLIPPPPSEFHIFEWQKDLHSHIGLKALPEGEVWYSCCRAGSTSEIKMSWSQANLAEGGRLYSSFSIKYKTIYNV